MPPPTSTVSRDPAMGIVAAVSPVTMKAAFRSRGSRLSRPSESVSVGISIAKSEKPLRKLNVDATRARPVAMTVA